VAFFDANIAVYAVDPRDASAPKKQVAREIVIERDCILSTQVLMETYNVLTKKKLMAPDAAHHYIRRLSMYDVVSIERDDVLRALEAKTLHGINHWDSLIVEAAQKGGADILYTEDLNHGQMYGSVRVCNPFIEDFLE